MSDVVAYAVGSITRAFAAGRLVRVRARGVSEAPMPLLAREGFAHYVEVLKERVAEHYDAVVIITGPVGSSKSTLALKLAQALDPGFQLQGSLCYTPADLLRRYETVKPGEVVLFDEGVRGLLAGDQNSVEQKALVQALALIREKSAILFICAPSIWLVAKQVRQGRATLWIHVLKRGTGLVHERNEMLRYKPDQTLGFSRSPTAPYLLWDKYPDGSAFWKAYLAEKSSRLDQYLIETADMLDKHNRRKVGKKVDNDDPDEAEEPSLLREIQQPATDLGNISARPARAPESIRERNARYKREQRARKKEKMAAAAQASVPPHVS